MKKRLFLFLILVLPLTGFTETYTVDTAHSRIGFSIRHFVINTIHGNFSDYNGTIIYNPSDAALCSVKGTIQAGSIITQNERRDADLRSANFFDTAKYPKIHFESTKVEGKNGNLNVTGNFTMHGITKVISFPAIVKGPVKDLWGNKRIGVSARLRIARRDFGILYDRKMDSGDVVLSDDVEIAIDAEAVEEGLN